ncbi:hypothetical protein Ahy_A03g012006 [Arachis hypogaea]|uniref:Aminotransferase-like plant mobile domain-containing protein n=1 Tax=Arachis hypogaea TaxID=3818 RepID=A0A445DSA1_ARAHY|nr:hypothetical protein Ahy_A03g012006 [Arachis hypogaea]
MARHAENDGDINWLNEMSHYTEVSDFERPRLLLLRRVSHTLPPSDAIVPYLAKAGFGDTVPLKDFTFDNSLISTLVERWRPETHMFHLPWSEVTITLQDVVYHLDLRVHGNPVGECFGDFGRWSSCWVLGLWWQHNRLRRGKSPSRSSLCGYGSMSARCPPTDDLEILRQYARTSRSEGHFLGTGCVGLDIYQKFSQWCPPDRGIYQYPLATRLVGLQQQSRDQHEAKVLHWRVSIDRLRFDEFAWRVY